MNIPEPNPDHLEDYAGFSARLRAQTPIALPAHWRADILAAARRALPLPPASKPRRFVWFTMALWPHPYAYAVLALVWLSILMLRWSTPISHTAVRQIAGGIAPSDDSLALEHTQLAINTVLFASFHQREVRQ